MDTTPGGNPKVEGRKFCRPINRMAPIKKEFLLTTQGLEKHTFDMGNVKNANQIFGPTLQE